MVSITMSVLVFTDVDFVSTRLLAFVSTTSGHVLESKADAFTLVRFTQVSCRVSVKQKYLINNDTTYRISVNTALEISTQGWY